MSAFLQSGRSDHGNSQISKVRFRPEAVVRDKEKTRHKGGKDAEPGHSICD